MTDISKRLCLCLILFCLFFLTACSQKSFKADSKSTGGYYQRMNYRTGSFQRSYRIHIPPGYEGKKPLPLVIALHGAFSTAKKMEEETGMSDLADKENFLVLYPNGIGFSGFLQHWNAGHCCGKAWKDSIDDTGFLKAAIEDVCAHVSVDPERIYLVGYSNGGMLAYQFAAQEKNILAAVAVVSTTIGSRSDDQAPWLSIPEPKEQIPVLIIHGRDDDHIPFNGGKARGGKSSESFYSVKDSIAFWVESNKGIEDSRKNHSNNNITHEMWFTRNRWLVVEAYLLDRWGHDWPGPTNYDPDSPFQDFDASVIIWNFLKKYSRKNKPYQ